jgi:GrpB-like predicted nucleotidyltransferase (UPF0157 family)
MTAPLGLESGLVRLVDYDPRWPELFAAEADRLRAVVTPLSVTLEHIGSTAISGLCAKPILDILAGYDDPARLQDCIAGLTAAGYTHRGERGIPGREFFRRGIPRAYHIHLARRGGDFWLDHLRFRDALRADPALRDGYARVKRELAEQYPADREAYIEGKGPFVLGVLSRAAATQPPE